MVPHQLGETISRETEIERVGGECWRGGRWPLKIAPLNVLSRRTAVAYAKETRPLFPQHTEHPKENLTTGFMYVRGKFSKDPEA